MNKYYRTKSNGIYELKDILAVTKRDGKDVIIIDDVNPPLVVKKSSNDLFDLIDYGDVIRAYGGLIECSKDDDGWGSNTLKWLKDMNNYMHVTEWYIKKGNDYVLVAKGNDGKLDLL